jgi:cobalt-precorrin-5B (C1)-methyltransferase
LQGGAASASVIKDAGDDPDITHGAEIGATVSIVRDDPAALTPAVSLNRDVKDADHGDGDRPRVLLTAGKGVGIVTKPGLPVAPGEPAINPVPRQMLSENVSLELQRFVDFPNNFCVMVEIEVPRGEELSRRTLNPRLGIIGGISILGTTGIVKPFSNEAYEQTIQAAFSVAANFCHTVVLSTGGKSERFARDMFAWLPYEAFVQIADFFSFAVGQARLFGFSRIIHSVFLGKAIKMAQGHPYTHAHSVPLDLDFLADTARKLGHDNTHCRQLASANTARHALEIIAAKGSYDIVESVSKRAASQSARLAGAGVEIRLLLFHYDGRHLADVRGE